MSFPHYTDPTAQEAAEHCGSYILKKLQEKHSTESKVTLAISGGSTPRPMFEYMAKAQFDVIHRGIGPDAHTTSLFPDEPLIEDRENFVAAGWVEKMNQWRITMVPGVLLAIIFEGPFDSKKYPAQALAHQGRGTTWFFDADAAKLIDA